MFKTKFVPSPWIAFSLVSLAGLGGLIGCNAEIKTAGNGGSFDIPLSSGKPAANAASQPRVQLKFDPELDPALLGYWESGPATDAQHPFIRIDLRQPAEITTGVATWLESTRNSNSAYAWKYELRSSRTERKLKIFAAVVDSRPEARELGPIQPGMICEYEVRALTGRNKELYLSCQAEPYAALYGVGSNVPQSLRLTYTASSVNEQLYESPRARQERLAIEKARQAIERLANEHEQARQKLEDAARAAGVPTAPVPQARAAFVAPQLSPGVDLVCGNLNLYLQADLGGAHRADGFLMERDANGADGELVRIDWFWQGQSEIHESHQCYTRKTADGFHWYFVPKALFQKASQLQPGQPVQVRHWFRGADKAEEVTPLTCTVAAWRSVSSQQWPASVSNVTGKLDLYRPSSKPTDTQKLERSLSDCHSRITTQAGAASGSLVIQFEDTICENGGAFSAAQPPIELTWDASGALLSQGVPVGRVTDDGISVSLERAVSASNKVNLRLKLELPRNGAAALEFEMFSSQKKVSTVRSSGAVQACLERDGRCRSEFDRVLAQRQAAAAACASDPKANKCPEDLKTLSADGAISAR